MHFVEARKKELPDRRILTKKINENMILISNINQKIQNFISLSDLFCDEEQIDKIRSQIINDYKILRASKRKIKSAYEFLPQDDIEFADLYKSYNSKLTSLNLRYQNIINCSLIGSRTLAMISNINDKLSLHAYDLQDHWSRCFPLEILQKGSYVVALPKSRLFIYSSGYTYQLSISNTFDLKSSTKTKIHEKWDYLCSGGVYYKNSVYLFGRVKYHFQKRTAVMRFDLEKKLWCHVALFPEPFGECTCIIFKDSILICGEMHEKLYKYDLNIESYSCIKIDLIMKIYAPRVLFKAGSRVYFLERVSGILESELENEYTYTRIGSFEHECYKFSQVKYYNHDAYFIADGRKNVQIFKFVLSSKKIILIKN